MGRPPRITRRAYLASCFGYFYAIGETRKHLGGVMATWWKIERARYVDLSVSGREERGALRIRFGHHLLHVFNVHLGTGFRERREQAAYMDRQILKAIDISGPRVVLGDFNEWTHGLVTRTLSTQFHATDLGGHLPPKRACPAGLPLLLSTDIYRVPISTALAEDAAQTKP